MNKEIIEKIYNYWSKDRFGREMINSNNVSEFDLLFLIPNNKKKILGLPLTRICRKHNKKKYKRTKKDYIYSFKMFEIIGSVVDELIGSNFDDEKCFQEFIEV